MNYAAATLVRNMLGRSPRSLTIGAALLLCLPVVSAAQDATPAQPKSESGPRTFAGTWTTTYGLMQLNQSGKRLTGTYGDNAIIEGALEGRRFRFRYREPAEAGEGWFELSTDGASITGRWRADGRTVWQDWKGRRTAAKQLAPKNFAGLWTTSFGMMRLSQVGNKVSGSYALDPSSKVNGEVRDGKLEFKYVEASARGEGSFQLSANKDQFVGRWRESGSTQWRAWTGRRVTPQRGKLWLVILEAHWEAGLNEREFAFGDMLRSYFKMAPARHIEVRHRYFHDENDFRRFCAEVPYLAEPVVLLISTHGTEKGIRVAGKTIGPKAIGEALSGADNIQLLHLSGCSMMNGPVPKQIHEHLGKGTRFPISGYSNVVAWDASAIGDFVFLSMLMIHRMDLPQAMQQAKTAAPYLGSEWIPGSTYRPLGLEMLVAPPEREAKTEQSESTNDDSK